MKIGSVLSDSIKYPFISPKRLVVLGIILFIGDLYNNFISNGYNILVYILIPIGFFFILLSYGYAIRIIRSSLDGIEHLPPFNKIPGMFVDGVKVLIVSVVYILPYVLIVILAILIAPLLGHMNASFLMIFLLILFALYLLIMLSIWLLAIANMAHGGRLKDAFKFRTLLSLITRIGLLNFVIWYILVGIISLLLIFVGRLMVDLFSFIGVVIVGSFVYSLVLSYANIFLFRSVALVYESGGMEILQCSKCGGIYELGEDESADDFESCQCGGELKQVKKYV